MISALTLVTAAIPGFCGFYVAGAGGSLFNNATQVALMREGTRTVLSMQNNYQGPPKNFAMVVPVPVVLQKENVKTLDRAVFERLDTLSAPRLVEYWEQDPCYVPPWEGIGPLGTKGRGGGTGGYGLGSGGGVKVEAQFVVGEYDIVILSADDALGMETWLKREKYAIPAGAEALFRPYIEKGMYFFVAKVDVKKVAFDTRGPGGNAALSPLRFAYDSEKFELPIRLGLINAKATQDLVVHVIAAKQRYELANYPNVTIPTNIDVVPSARVEFPSFYASLFDRTLKANPSAIVTEYAWPVGSCDPCPGTNGMTRHDFLALGGDQLANAANPKARGLAMANWREFVVTRLHARYDKTSLGDDLVFKAAPPIAGGREVILSKTEALERGAQPWTVNNFQARYVIRHPWTGPVACEEPQFNRWGGPSETSAKNEVDRPAVSARNTALVKRDEAKVEKLAESAIAELDIKGLKPEAGKAIPVKRKK